MQIIDVLSHKNRIFNSATYCQNYDTDLSYNTFNFDAMLRDYPESGLNLHSTLHVTSYSQVDDTEEVNQNGVPPLTKPLKGR